MKLPGRRISPAVSAVALLLFLLCYNSLNVVNRWKYPSNKLQNGEYQRELVKSQSRFITQARSRNVVEKQRIQQRMKQNRQFHDPVM